MYLPARKRKWILATIFSVSCAFGAAPGLAQVDPGQAGPAHAFNEGRPSPSEKWPQATLSAEAAAEVAQDTVKITLATEVSGASQAAVAAALSKTLSSVMQRAKGSDTVKANSGNYSVWPMNDKDGKISNWRGRAEIFLESTDFQAASDLAGKLDTDMPIANLSFFVSPQARARQEAALLEQAAQAFRARAQELTDAMGFAGYSLRNIDLGGSGANYAPAPRMMAMAAMKDSVPLEGGTERVTLSMRGSIFLHSAKK